VDETVDHTARKARSGQDAAESLRSNAARHESARRLLPGTRGDRGISRLAGIAARLVGAPSAQVSLLTDVQVVLGGAGPAAGAVGAESPLEESLCTVTAERGGPLAIVDARSDEQYRDLAVVRTGRVVSYLGVPLRGAEGAVVGALCVYGPEPRSWAEGDVLALEDLAGAVVTELELEALRRRVEGDHVRWGLAVEAAGLGTFDWDLISGRLVWDERLLELFGYDATDFEESIEAFNARVHPDDLPRVSEAVSTCLASCGEYEAHYRVIRPDGDVRWVHARGRAVPGPDGAAVRLLGTAYDTTDQRNVETRVSRVLEAMPAGFYSLDRDWRFTHVNAEAERLLGRSREDLLGRVLWEEWPAAVNSIFEESYRAAVRTGRPVSFDAFYPAPLDGWYELRAWPSPDGLSVYFLEVTERRRVQERAEESTKRLALLARVSAELAGTLDAAAAIARIPRLVVPELADFCVVTVLDGDGRPRDVGSWDAEPGLRPVLDRYTARRLHTAPASSPLARALASGVAVREELPPLAEMMTASDAGDLLELLAPRAVAVLPLRGRGRMLGLLTLYSRTHAFGREDDLATAQDVADRAGLALDNARLYRAQQQLAEGLQRSLLTEPPEPDHAEIAVRYAPAAEAARVGGDWYDAFLQPSGATMLVIGDVVGHDTAAAAVMGQLRGLLRGIATYSDAGPAEVLRGLDASMTTLQVRALATAAVARFEQTPAEFRDGVTRMRWANAGHLPPLVMAPDGSVAELTSWTGDLLLGVDAATERRESVVTLERGSTVLLYTDGLIERRDADLDAGLARLRATLAELAGRPLQQLLDALLERLVDGHPQDDVALVAVRLHPQDGPRPFEAGPESIPPGLPADPAHP
jgi:PAS domain S-box-containing protein